MDNMEDLLANQSLSAHEVASILVSRLRTYGDLGMDWEGTRDYYKVLKYKKTVDLQDYLNAYFRDDIASRIINLPPKDTWKDTPVLIDGGERSNSKEKIKSPFLQAYNTLVDFGLIRYLQRLDKLARLGRYGVMLLGTADSSPLDKPIGRKFNGPDGLLYLAPKPEKMAEISQIDKDTKSRRHGKPLLYSMEFGIDEGDLTIGTKPVHFTRVIHVAEDLLDNDVIGVPPMLKIMNRVDDLIKVVGGGAEAFWKNIRQGLAFVANSGASAALNPTAEKDVKAQLEEYDNGLRRILTLGGVTPHSLGSSTVDPSGMFGVVISLIAAASEIPQRILIGSERGELASGQDMVAWNNIISDRQKNYAEPAFLRAFISWAITWGIMPPPKRGDYDVEWKTVFSMSDAEKADRATKLAGAITSYMAQTGLTNIVTPNEFREILGLPPADWITDDMVEPAETPQEKDAFEENQKQLGENQDGEEGGKE